VRWTILTGQSKAEAAALFCEVFCMHSSRGVALVLGELACVQGGSLWFSSFGLVVCALCLSMFCLGCIESLPLPKGSET
jgi:hypothetical protein